MKALDQEDEPDLEDALVDLEFSIESTESKKGNKGI